MDRPCAQVPPIVSELDSLSRSLRRDEPVVRQRVEEALERGFGELMQLEAELQRQERSSAPTTRPREKADLAAVRLRIRELHEALNRLRTVSSPTEASRIGYGFVLPAAASTEASSDNE